MRLSNILVLATAFSGAALAQPSERRPSQVCEQVCPGMEPDCLGECAVCFDCKNAGMPPVVNAPEPTGCAYDCLKLKGATKVQERCSTACFCAAQKCPARFYNIG